MQYILRLPIILSICVTIIIITERFSEVNCFRRVRVGRLRRPRTEGF